MSRSSQTDTTKLFLPRDDLTQFMMITEEMCRNGIRFSETDLLAIWKLCRTVPNVITMTIFLEVGNEKSGWMHVLQEHEHQFTDCNMSSPFRAVDDTIRGEHTRCTLQGEKPGLLSLIFDDIGSKVYVYCAVGTNGYIVTAFPVGLKNLTTFLKKRNIHVRTGPEIGSPSNLSVETSVTGAENHPNNDQEIDSCQIYVAWNAAACLYISEVGESKTNIASYDYFADLGMLSANLIELFEKFDDMVYWYHETRLTDELLDEAKQLLSPPNLAYLLKKELHEKKYSCTVYGQFDASLQDSSVYIEATEQNLRAARNIVAHRVLDIMQEQELQYTTELSSSHRDANSSPRKNTVLRSQSIAI